MEIDLNRIILLIVLYISAIIISTIIVKLTINILDKKRYRNKMHIMDTGFVIGTCETFIIITLVLMNEITGLALIFTAKTIVRHKDIAKKPEYYLVGTMVNFTIALLMGLIIKYMIT